MGTDMRVLAGIALAAGLALGGCQTVQHNTASQKPEVTIAAPSAKVKPAVINAFINDGYNITSDSQYLVVMRKASDNVGATLLFGSTNYPAVDERVNLTFAEMDGKTRIVADTSFVANPGTGFEEVIPTTRFEESAEVQTMLDKVKAGWSPAS